MGDLDATLRIRQSEHSPTQRGSASRLWDGERFGVIWVQSWFCEGTRGGGVDYLDDMARCEEDMFGSMDVVGLFRVWLRGVWMGSRTPIIFSLTTTIDTFFGPLVTVPKTGVMSRKQMNGEHCLRKLFKAVIDQTLKLVHLLCAEFPTVRFAMRIISYPYHRDISDLTLDFFFPHVHNEFGYGPSPEYIRPYGRPLSSTTFIVISRASNSALCAVPEAVGDSRIINASLQQFKPVSIS